MDKHFADLATNEDNYLGRIAASTKPEHIVMDINFALLTHTLAAFGLADLYNLVTKVSIQSDRVNAVLDDWFRQISTQPMSDVQKQKLIALWNYLAEDDGIEVEPADVILVFGGPETTKAHKAAELYKAGKAPKIIFTGDTQRALVHEPHVSESVRDAAVAMEAGVPRSAILIDDKSINTPENVQNALKLLDGAEPFPTSFIIVNLPWYLRRATNTFLTYWRQAPVEIKRLHRINAGSDQFNANNYFQERKGLAYIVFEYLKIMQARAMGHM